MIPIEAIVTVPPHATFLEDVARHPLVSGLRLNTVMPLAEPIPAALERLRRVAGGKALHVDLKGRQLRVAEAAVPPFTAVTLTHEVRLRTPATAYFDDGREEARVLAVLGRRLILEDGPRRFVGPGESINIPDASLEVAGTLTETDRAHVEACRALGIDDLMLSFVERDEDVEELRALHPAARITAKIESRRGLRWAREAAPEGRPRLMAARGDLYVEVARPHEVLAAVRGIVEADPHAIVASRLFPSLSRGPVPSASDIADAAFLLAIGYRTFMLGDEVCQRRDSALAALNLLEEIAAAEPDGARCRAAAAPALRPREEALACA